MTAPGIYASWDFSMSPDEILIECKNLILEMEKRYDEIAALKTDEVTIESVIKELAYTVDEYNTRRSPLIYPKLLALNKDLRDACMEADRLLKDFELKVATREDIFNLLMLLDDQAETSSLSSEEKRFLQKLIKEGRRNGVHLPADQKKSLEALRQKINSLSIQFTGNLGEVNTVLEFTAEELDGLPEDFLENLKKTESGKLELTLKYPHYFPVMRKARNPETRKKLDFAFNTQCIRENTPILEELISSRHEAANLLGFPTHAAFSTDILMSKTAEDVHDFLMALVPKFTTLWEDERKVMLEFKKNECEELGLKFNGKLNNWDLAHYSTLLKEKNYSVDQEKLRQYFPLPAVTEGLFKIYQDLLGLKFEEVENAKTWHPDVKLFNVTDMESQTLLGYFFLDLFPREGKYSHARILGLQLSAIQRDGTRRPVVIALVANFTKPTKEKASLLDHNELRTYFHEFGHVMHSICSQNSIAVFSGYLVEKDFLECPSKMLENWIWEEEPLKIMSRHYQTNDPLPNDLIDCLIKSRLVNIGCFTLRQIALSLFDHSIHTKPEVDIQKEYNKTIEKITGITPQEGTSFPCHFNHMAHNYDAKYYGYLWSEVFSADMFYTRFKAEGVLNKKTGMDYRKKILEPGATMDGYEVLRNFLGREPNQKAFLVTKGIA